MVLHSGLLVVFFVGDAWWRLSWGHHVPMQLQQHRARLALPYTNLLEVFKPYMPFFTREDYFKFAYDNVNSPVYRHFWILLILFYENDYPIDQSNHYPRNFSSCEKRETCKERRNYSEGLPSYLQIPRFYIL